MTALTLPGMETSPSPVQVKLLNFMEQPVRAFVDAGREMWFMAKDVCDALGLGNPTRALSEHPKEESLTLPVVRAGQSREMLFINEPGLYRLIFKSRKAEAEAFKTWVCKEVLPAIRRRGSYHAPRHAKFPGMLTGKAGRPSLVKAMLALDFTPLKPALPPEGLQFARMIDALFAYAVAAGAVPGASRSAGAGLLGGLMSQKRVTKTGLLYTLA